MSLSKLFIFGLTLIFFVKVAESNYYWNSDPCRSYYCPHKCCKVSRYGYYKRAYCIRPRDPCTSHYCNRGRKCVSYGHGCNKKARCVNTNPCHDYKCNYGCKCKVSGYGYNIKATCEKPKNPCKNYYCGYGKRCESYGYGCYKKARCVGCSSPPPPQYGYIVSPKSRYNSKEWVTYGCNKGYCLSGDGKAQCIYGKWKGKTTCQKSCFHRKAPLNGYYYNSKKSWCPSDSARFKCNKGFRMVGRSVSTCQKDGSWDYDVPSCERTCKPLLNGYVVYRFSNYLCNYACNKGYCLKGPRTIYFLYSRWIATPKCLKSCSHRPKPSYGFYYGSKKHWCPGDRARFKCNRGYGLVGNGYSQCGYNGWKSSVPVCRRTCTPPLNGYIVNRYGNYHRCNYACNKGYCLKGPRTSYYYLYSRWTITPKCIKSCSHRSSPSNGSYYGNQTYWCSGDKARFRCKSGFSMYGQENSTCLIGNWSSDVPKCRRNPCQGYKCGYGCKCRVRGYGHYKEAYCGTWRDPCHDYRCPYTYKCQSYGHGCYKRKRCVLRYRGK